MICISLHHIHSKNIVHLDLTPKNILSTFIGEQEMIIIIDFVSYIPEPLSDDRRKMPDFYFSIEQLNLEDVHPSFNIWSLGINLYFFMAKKEPYS